MSGRETSAEALVVVGRRSKLRHPTPPSNGVGRRLPRRSAASRLLATAWIDHGRRGMTLLEVLVAIAIFSVLGGTLVMLLSRGVKAWRGSEARRESYEEAQSVLRQVRSDLKSMFTSRPAVTGQPVEARFVGWFDADGTQRLCFTRTIQSEDRHPIAALAGTTLFAERDLDGVGDWKEAKAGDLRATGGLMEVLYARDPGDADVLLRAARSPVGGQDSLFGFAQADDTEWLREVAKPLSTRVMHFELRYWSQHTTTWDGGTAVIPNPLPDDESGPSFVWDSTRGLLDAGRDLQEEEQWLARGTLQRPDDDLFPTRIMIVLVVAEAIPAGPNELLDRALDATDREIYIPSTKAFRSRLKAHPWVRVDQEWIRCKVTRTDRLKVEPGGRGGRGTVAVAHEAGAEVVTGRTFVSVIELPSGREWWGE